MSDQCRHCKHYGNIKDCMEDECFLHENWYVIELKKELAAKDALLEEAVECLETLASFGTYTSKRTKLSSLMAAEAILTLKIINEAAK